MANGAFEEKECVVVYECVGAAVEAVKCCYGCAVGGVEELGGWVVSLGSEEGE